MISSSDRAQYGRANSTMVGYGTASGGAHWLFLGSLVAGALLLLHGNVVAGIAVPAVTWLLALVFG
jgi:hypothetical protein